MLAVFELCNNKIYEAFNAHLNCRPDVVIARLTDPVSPRLSSLSRTLSWDNKHSKLFLVVHSPRYNGRPVQVDGTGGVIAPVHGDHRYMARHLCNTAFSETLFTTFD